MKDGEAETMTDLLAEFQTETGEMTDAFTTMTDSIGENMKIEVTSLAVMSFLNFQKYSENAKKGIDYIIKQNKEGAFGSS